LALDPRIEIDSELARKIRLASVVAEGLEIDNAEGLWAVFQPFCTELAARYRDVSIGEVPGIQAARQLYHAIGIDPTKLRPSSEGLLRRALQGKNLYRINSLVDTINYCSLSYLLPVGLYDLDYVQGESINLRKGGPGESFDGIRKESVHLEGRYGLFDSAGPFGSPTSDSDRTRIREQTSRALVVIFAPYEISEEVLDGHAQFTADQVSRFGGGQPDTRMGQIVG
jgi:DNA/RNA-binding domain of Phe-tRNA-synthetase-like protein